MKVMLNLLNGVRQAMTANTYPVSHYLEGIDFYLNQIIAERVNYEPKWIKLVLRPLSEIIDEDYLGIYTATIGRFKK